MIAYAEGLAQMGDRMVAHLSRKHPEWRVKRGELTGYLTIPIYIQSGRQEYKYELAVQQLLGPGVTSLGRWLDGVVSRAFGGK